MGSNMMRQAVPLLRSEAPIVGTGIERQLVRDSRTQITAEGDGVVDFVDATTIRILYDRTEDEEFVSFEPALKEYRIPKFRKTNQNMTIDLRPICDKGQRVKKGDILTEGYSTEKGELALGKNLLVAYMPWKGYNYEDAIVLNERVVREDLLTSVHVEEYSLEVRETKRGMEELTSDIPNVSEEATKDLDENGIVRIGARIEPGDIMIGKITPKGESDPSPEEKLLRAIFGDKAGDVKDASLKASPSLKGVVIDKKLFSRVIKNRSSKLADKALLPKIDDEFESKVADLKRILVKKLMILTEGKVSQGVKDYLGAEVIAKGSKFSASDFDSLDFTSIQLSNWTSDEHANGMIRDLVMNFIKKYKELDAELKRKKFAITIGDELPAGIIQMAKVYIAKKRKIGVGDKMAGRHGNKGIVSRVVRQEDMPFLADGTTVDIVLNPLGVPSRMNIGQIFEAVLGRAGKTLGVKFANKSPCIPPPSSGKSGRGEGALFPVATLLPVAEVIPFPEISFLSTRSMSVLNSNSSKMLRSEFSSASSRTRASISSWIGTSILMVARNFENVIISRLVSTFVFNAPFSWSVCSNRFSMLPNSETSF